MGPGRRHVTVKQTSCRVYGRTRCVPQLWGWKNKSGPPAVKRAGPGNDALRVELRRSSSPDVGMRGAELKLPGFKDPATECQCRLSDYIPLGRRCAASASVALRERPIAADSASLSIRASAWASPARGGGRRFSKKNPPLATGPSLGRNGKVSRFAAALCVVIHTRSGKLYSSIAWPSQLPAATVIFPVA
jgi:hypothetical protein